MLRSTQAARKPSRRQCYANQSGNPSEAQTTVDRLSIKNAGELVRTLCGSRKKMAPRKAENFSWHRPSGRCSSCRKQRSDIWQARPSHENFSGSVRSLQNPPGVHDLYISSINHRHGSLGKDFDRDRREKKFACASLASRFLVLALSPLLPFSPLYPSRAFSPTPPWADISLAFAPSDKTYMCPAPGRMAPGRCRWRPRPAPGRIVASLLALARDIPGAANFIGCFILHAPFTFNGTCSFPLALDSKCPSPTSIDRGSFRWR